MKDKDINKHLNQVIRDSTPDMLEDLMKELELNDVSTQNDVSIASEERIQVVPQNQPRRKAGRIIKILAPLVAAIVIVAGVFIHGQITQTAFAYVDLDVNPGIEITIDKDDTVVSATAVNKEGKDILSDMRLKGSDVHVACNAVVGAMLTKGYLTDTSNSILISVYAKEKTHGKQLERQLSKDLNSYLENASIATAVLQQYVEEDKELLAFAKENKISSGKAWLIRTLLAKGGPKMTEGSLLKLSTQELILLAQEKNLTGSDMTGNADKSNYISSEKATSIALAKAGLKKTQTHHFSSEFDCDDGKLIYEIDFRAGGKEYEYDIDAVSGTILESEINEDEDVNDTTDQADDLDDNDRDDLNDFDDDRDDDANDYDDDNDLEDQDHDDMDDPDDYDHHDEDHDKDFDDNDDNHDDSDDHEDDGHDQDDDENDDD